VWRDSDILSNMILSRSSIIKWPLP